MAWKAEIMRIPYLSLFSMCVKCLCQWWLKKSLVHFFWDTLYKIINLLFNVLFILFPVFLHITFIFNFSQRHFMKLNLTEWLTFSWITYLLTACARNVVSQIVKTSPMRRGIRPLREENNILLIKRYDEELDLWKTILKCLLLENKIYLRSYINSHNPGFWFIHSKSRVNSFCTWAFIYACIYLYV